MASGDTLLTLENTNRESQLKYVTQGEQKVGTNENNKSKQATKLKSNQLNLGQLFYFIVL